MDPQPQIPDPAQDDAYALDTSVIEAVRAAVEAGLSAELVATLDPLHPADIADLMEQISPAERDQMIELWGEDFDGTVLIEAEEGLRDELLEAVDDDVLADAMSAMESDDVVYLVEDLDEPDQERLLDALDDADRAAVETALQYPEDSAGRMMQLEIVTAPTFWAVGDAIDFMRAEDDLPDDFYNIFITDPRMRPVGTVRLSQVMANRREVALIDIMDEDFRTIPADQNQEDVAYAFNQYHMVSAAVVDEDGRLVGVINMDDAMEALEDEAEEDLKLLAGVGDEELTDSVRDTVRARFPWLAVNLVATLLAAVVISQFADTIQTIVALAVLMPIVASMGGNAGTQTLTVAVRALATRDLTSANMWRIVRREVLVGLFNGVIFAVVVGLIGAIWFGTAALGLVLGLAMVVNLLVAGLAGILVPIILDRLKADPALASGTFVMTLTDVIGFFTFLGLATLILL